MGTGYSVLWNSPLMFQTFEQEDLSSVNGTKLLSCLDIADGMKKKPGDGWLAAATRWVRGRDDI